MKQHLSLLVLFCTFLNCHSVAIELTVWHKIDKQGNTHTIWACGDRHIEHESDFTDYAPPSFLQLIQQQRSSLIDCAGTLNALVLVEDSADKYHLPTGQRAFLDNLTTVCSTHSISSANIEYRMFFSDNPDILYQNYKHQILQQYTTSDAQKLAGWITTIDKNERRETQSGYESCWINDLMTIHNIMQQRRSMPGNIHTFLCVGVSHLDNLSLILPRFGYHLHATYLHYNFEDNPLSITQHVHTELARLPQLKRN